MSKRGLDFDKLNRIQEENKKNLSVIREQIEIQVEEYGELLLKKIGVKPNPKDFVNWFYDNHTSVIKRKRKFPFKLNMEYVVEYCLLVKQELSKEIISQKHSLNGFLAEIDDYEYFDAIFELLIKLFEKDEYIDEYIVIQIAKETSYILRERKKIPELTKIKGNQISTKQESIRYCFYQIYLLQKKPAVRKYLIEYLFEKFEVFDNNEYDSINKHFSEEPPYYPV